MSAGSCIEILVNAPARHLAMQAGQNAGDNIAGRRKTYFPAENQKTFFQVTLRLRNSQGIRLEGSFDCPHIRFGHDILFLALLGPARRYALHFNA